MYRLKPAACASVIVGGSTALVSIIDEFTFGDLRSFNAQFGHAKGTSAEYN